MSMYSESLGALPGLVHAFGNANDVCIPRNLFYCAQKNGATVIEVGEKEDAGLIAGDAIFTRTGRPIGIVTADCLPILIGSEDGQFVAAIHGGWQGLVAGVIENSFESFRSAGVSVQNLKVAIGPAIQSCCYEVGSDLIDKIERVHGHLWSEELKPWSGSRDAARLSSMSAVAPHTGGVAWLDLTCYCLYLLNAVGVARLQIETMNLCTYCSGTDWGSYRRRIHRGEKKFFQYSWISLRSGSV